MIKITLPPPGVILAWCAIATAVAATALLAFPWEIVQ